MDNQSVTNSVDIGAHTLQKKHNAICYHQVREALLMEMIRVGYISGASNPSDIFTKILAKVSRKKCLSNMVLGVYYPDSVSRNEQLERRTEIGNGKLLRWKWCTDKH